MEETSKNLLENAAKSLTNERLKLILFPTEQCNFRCLYCYEDYQLPRMSNEIVGSIKLFLKKKNSIIKII